MSKSSPVCFHVAFNCVVFGVLFAGCSDDSANSGLAQSDGSGLAINDSGLGVGDTAGPESEPDASRVVSAACTSNDECEGIVNDLRPCESVECMDNGDCVVFPVTDCCEHSSDCPVIEEECIESFCPSPGQACATRSICSLCNNHSDCIEAADSCEVGWCSQGGRCEFKQLEICCNDASDCSLLDACVEAQCFDGRCLYQAKKDGECCDTEPVYIVGSDDEMKFATSSDNPTIMWQIIETKLTPSPPYALYVGNSETMSTATIGDVNAVAIFDLGNLLEGAQLDFRAHAFVNLANTGTQLFQVVLTGEGVADTILYDSNLETYDDWHLIHANVTVPGTSQYTVVMRYYQKGSIVGAELGVLLDNIEVRTDCSPYFECFDDIECDDGDPCTLDTCKVGLGTASCSHEPSPALEGEVEVCGDGLDNDCNPDTFCLAVKAGNNVLPVKPVAVGVNPGSFHDGAASVGSKYASPNTINILVSENSDTGKALHVILDQAEDGSGGNLTVAIDGPQGTDILVYDDPPEEASDSWDYDPAAGTGSISWVWGACCVDGVAMAPLTVDACVKIVPQTYEGLDALTVWQDAATSAALPIGPIEVCGSL